MNLFNMRGSWKGQIAFIYDKVVAAGMDRLYELLAETFFSNLPSDCRILDLGCGAGQVSINIAKKNPLAEVVGVDLSHSQIARAKKRSLNIRNANFMCGDAMRLDFPADWFDIALSVASIKHWPDQLKGLKEMRRVLKRGGTVYVFEANAQCSQEEARNFVAKWRWVLPGTRPLVRWYFQKFIAKQALTAGELNDLLRQAGFSDIDVQKVPGDPILVARGKK